MFEKEKKEKIKKEFTQSEIIALDNELETYRSDIIFEGRKFWGLTLANRFRFLQNKGIIVMKEIKDEMLTMSQLPNLGIRKIKEYAEFENKIESVEKMRQIKKAGSFGI